MRNAARITVSFVIISLSTAGIAQAQSQPYYIFESALDIAYVVQNGTVQFTFDTSAVPEQGVLPSIRKDALYLGSSEDLGAVEYDRAGVPTSNTMLGAGNFGDLVDGTTDGVVYNYTITSTFEPGFVVRTSLFWSNSEALFVPPMAGRGIAYDPTDNTLWLALSDGSIRHFSLSGAELSSFTPDIGAGVLCCLAYDEVADSLWFKHRGGGTLYEYSKTGVPRQTVVVPGFSPSNDFGGEMPMTVLDPVESAHLMVPVIARTAGQLGSFWSTQLRILNPEDAVMLVRLSFVQLDLSSPDLVKIIAISAVQLQPKETFFIDDIAAAITGIVDEDLKGSLHIEVLDDHEGVPVITSRTATLGAIGSYGQFIPALQEWSPPPDSLGLAGLIDNDEFRTNIGVSSFEDHTVSVELVAYDAAGNEIGRQGVGVPRFANNQISARALFPGLGDTEVFAVRVDTGRANVIVYATVMYNETSDPVFILARNASAQPDRQIVPNLAHIDGKFGSVWRTDFAVRSLNPTDASTLKLEYFPDSSDGFPWASRELQFNLDPLQGLLLEDLVGQFLDDPDVDQTKGYLMASIDGILGPAGAPLISGRTYTIDGETQYGQSLRAFESSYLMSFPDRAWVAGVEDSADSRTNFALLNLGDIPARVELRFYDEFGELRTGAATLALLDPGEFVQFDLFAALPALEPGSMRGSLQIIILDGYDLLPYVTMIDNGSNDPIFVPMTIPKPEEVS